ncbi:MAG: hypothetical protein AAF514_17955, partial [Verrucomicrobiota bacterium]
LKGHPIPGSLRTAIGITGNDGGLEPGQFELLEGVAEFCLAGDSIATSASSADLIDANTQAIAIDATFFLEALLGGNGDIVNVGQPGGSSIVLNGSGLTGNGVTLFTAADFGPYLTECQLHRLLVILDCDGYTLWVDHHLIGQVAAPDDLDSWTNSGSTDLTFGNFKGWLDDLTLYNIDDL